MTNNTITSRIARYVALPIVSAGIISSAALGLAGTANAVPSMPPSGPGHLFSPAVTAHPANDLSRDFQGHHGPGKIKKFVPDYKR